MTDRTDTSAEACAEMASYIMIEGIDDAERPMVAALIRALVRERDEARASKQVADNLRKVATGYEATIRKLMDDNLALERRIKEALL